MRSLRARFILAYAGLVVLGFGMLALVAGRQLARTAREDFEAQLRNEVRLVAHGMEEIGSGYYQGELSQTDLDDVVATYGLQTDSNITLFLTPQPVRLEPPQNDPGGDPFPLTDEWKKYPELVSASQHEDKLVKREDEQGKSYIYVASAIMSRGGFLGYVQLREPTSNLDRAIYGRWAALGIGVAAITFVALLASVWLSISLIRPLASLKNSAVQFSQGNLAHRAPKFATDEVDQVAAAFNHMADQLEAMLEEQRAFASNTSHELRTPLTTMRLRTEALRHDPTLDEATRTQYVQELDDELMRMSSLIEDLILLSRFDAGRAEIGMEQIDLLNFAESLLRQFREKAAEKAIELQVIPVDSAAGCVVRASLNHLTVVFRNVLENAIKYSEAGGCITWRIAVEGDKIVNVIQDNGHGILAEQLPHIFDRFYRGDKAHSRTIAGSGLGLSLVKAIVESYDGQINVDSGGAGQGTTVTIRWRRDAGEDF